MSQPTTQAIAIDLLSCTPDDLAAWLLTHRFEGNAMDVASFLLNCTSTLPNADEISAHLLGGGEGEDEEDDDCEDGNTDVGVKEEIPSTGANTMGCIPEASASVDTLSKTKSHDASSSQSALLQSNETSTPSLPLLATHCVEVSCINPRGKFMLSLLNHECSLTNPKLPQEQLRFSASSIQHVVWFRKPEDYKTLKQSSGNGKSKVRDVPGHMILICLEDGIIFRNKAVKQVCFQLPSYPHPSTTAVAATADNISGSGENNKQIRTERYWWNEFNAILLTNGTKHGIIRVAAKMDMPEFFAGKNNFFFCSEGESGRITTTEALPYVGCHQGFNDGALFPLREGLLFFKPPMFVPRSKLASISCGRGQGGSRFVDMVAQIDDDSTANEQEGKKSSKQSDTLEFTNIHRDELNGLNSYIHQILIPAMQSDADQADGSVAIATTTISSNGNEGNADGSDDHCCADVAVAEVVQSSDDDGDDNDSNNELEVEGGNIRHRPSRAAAKSAREITRAVLQSARGDDDASDDSVDFQEEEDPSDESESTDESDDQTDVSDDDSSSEESDFDEDDMNESDEGQTKKRARVV